MKWTNEKLFHAVIERLRDRGEYPESLLEYEFAAKEVSVGTCEVSCYGTLAWGSSEGIFVTVYLDGDERIGLGTFKTLQRNQRAWMTMGWLMTNFQWCCHEIMNEHIEEFC